MNAKTPRKRRRGKKTALILFQRKKSALSAAFFLSLTLGMTSGCSVLATRPVLQMSYTQAAIRAAKDLNADSLVPNLYRRAVENYFKAKTNYRLKKFDEARKYAIKARHLAEHAEFQAYRLGGATPEISSHLVSPEGASNDPDSTFQASPDAANAPVTPSPPAPVSQSAAPQTSQPQPMQNTPVQAPSPSQPSPSPSPTPTPQPSGPTGPAGPSGYNTYATPGEVPTGTSYNENAYPTTGGVTPTTGSAPQQATQPGTPTDLWNRKTYNRQRLNEVMNPLPPATPNFDKLDSGSLPTMGKTSQGKTNEIQSTDEAPLTGGLEEIHPKPFKPLVDKASTGFSGLYPPERKPKGKAKKGGSF